MHRTPAIAWFRDSSKRDVDSVDASALVRALQSSWTIDVIDQTRAHDFVWMHFRQPYDLCVYELANTRRHAFIWPYLFHYPGLLWLRGTELHDSRAQALEEDRRTRDYAAEFSFNHGIAPPLATETVRHLGRGHWPMLRAPLLASKLVVVSHATTAAALEAQYAGARIRHAPIGVDSVDEPPTMNDRQEVVFGVTSPSRLEVVERAVARAQEAGINATLLLNASPHDLARHCDVVLALKWPMVNEPLGAALYGMAARKPTVIFDMEITADWPALDPQSWRPRGTSTAAPIVVSIDPRDEEHSLVLAIRRLATDATLRTTLGTAAHTWWTTHATVHHAVSAWEPMLTEAISIQPPARPADWPPHLTADGTELATRILSEFDQEAEFL